MKENMEYQKANVKRLVKENEESKGGKQFMKVHRDRQNRMLSIPAKY